MPNKGYHDVGVRLQCLALLKSGIPVAQIEATLRVPKASIYRFRRLAVERGYNPTVDKRILLQYVADAARSGRPTVQTAENVQRVIDFVTSSKEGRTSTTHQIGARTGLAPRTVYRILKGAQFKPCKRTVKPGLTDAHREARYQFALRHEHWTLEDWKAVIWSDETSVILGSKRGRTRVWRRTFERHDKTCIWQRWKGYSEFMFWGCFTYDKKGPCHVWEPETQSSKDKARRFITKWNRDNEQRLKDEWELTTGLNRMGLHTRPGRRPVWNFNAAHGKMERKGGKGIDWWRYQYKILEAKLIPFAKECLQDRPDTVVQEDGAASHACKWQQEPFMRHKIKRLPWAGNSPDLNMIEPTWPHLKRRTTSRGAPSHRKTAASLWIKTWADLEQEAIQKWIERIPYHIKNIIKLRGGNEYPEGKHTI